MRQQAATEEAQEEYDCIPEILSRHAHTPEHGMHDTAAFSPFENDVVPYTPGRGGCHTYNIITSNNIMYMTLY